MTVWVFASAAVVVGLLVVWTGHQTLTRRGRHASGTADALGSFIDVFDPSRARADRDLRSQRNVGAVLPSPDDEPARPQWKVDLNRGEVTIRPPRRPGGRLSHP